MLRESLIANNSIKLNQSANSWQEAIKIGTDLLVASGAVEPRYYDNIIKMVGEMGPYIIIAPGLAMPHARPEDGVKKTAFALVTLKEPVMFEGEDEPVRLLITLAGSDNNQHTQGLMEITEMLDDPDSETGVNLDKILNCKSAEEVLSVIEKSLNK